MAGITFAPPQQGNRLKLNDKNELVQSTSVVPPARPDLTNRLAAAGVQAGVAAAGLPTAAAPVAATMAAAAPPAASPLQARAEQALAQRPSPAPPGQPAKPAAGETPFFTNRADLAAERGLSEVKGVVGNQTIFGNRQLAGKGGFVQASPGPKSDVNDYAEYGTGPMGAYVRSLLQNQDRVRKFKATNDTTKETAQSAREDARQAAINKRSDERLAFDKEKELASEVEKRFTTVDQDGKSSVDYTAAAEVKDYMTRTKTTDVGSAITGLQKEKALTVAKQYGDANGLKQAIDAEQDANRKARLQQLYAAAYGA